MDRYPSDESVSTRRQFMAAAGLTLAGVALAQPNVEKPDVVDEIYPGAFRAGEPALPPLPYDYNGLEPRIDELTLRLHHDKHHKSYVDGFKENLERLRQMRQSDNFEQIEHAERKLAFHGAGHILHCIYWASMGPESKNGRPSPDLSRQINADFGSREAMEKQLQRAAATAEGSGWALLAWSLPARRLVIMQVLNHQYNTMWTELPLMVIDVWEHAYYKKYGNERGEYLKNVAQVIDWPGISRRYDAIRSIVGTKQAAWVNHGRLPAV